MRLTTILIFFCVLVPAVFAQSESVVVFTPESLTEVIDERSQGVRLSSLMLEDARQGIQVAKNGYLPEVSASWQVGYLGDGYLTDRNFSDGMHIDNPHFTNNFALEAMQVIYSGGAVAQGVKMAQLRSQLAGLGLEESRQQVKFMLLSRLIDLQCRYRERDVIDQNIVLAREVLVQMQARFEQGVLLENDMTRYRLQIASMQLERDRCQEAINVANAGIANTLGYPEGTIFDLSSEAIDENLPVEDMESWQTTAADHSLALGKAALGIKMSETALKLTQSERLPHISAFAYGRFDSPITIEVPVLNKNFMYWGFGLNVSYSLSSIFKTGRKMAQAKAGVWESRVRHTLTGEALSDGISEAYEALLTARSQLRTQRYSLTLADQNYETVSSRFAEGMALVTDLVDAANVKLAAQTGVENARSRLLFSLYKLKFISNTL